MHKQNNDVGSYLLKLSSVSGRAVAGGAGYSGRARPRLAASRFLGLMTIILAGSVQADPPSVTVTYKVTTQAHTCTTSVSPSQLTLTEMRQSVFEAAGNTPAQSSGKKVTVSFQCSGTTTQTGQVSIAGTADSDQNLFANTYSGTDAAKGLGFILTKNADGDYAGLVKPPAAGQVTKVDMPGSQTATPPPIDFYLQVSRGSHAYSEVVPGILKTTINFDTVWN